jgi:cyclase
MTLAVRVIPCLDIDSGKVVKGVNFQEVKTIGDPIELATKYYADGADELTYLDITASKEDRAATLDLVSRTADTLFIPLTVGGGVRSVSDVGELLAAGADKVSIGSAAVYGIELLSSIAQKYGDQVVVVSLDIQRSSNTISGFELTTHGGSVSTGVDAFRWIEETQDIGIGELLLNSMDADGTKRGFDLELIKAVRNLTGLPLIASGGAGKVEDFVEASLAGASAVLAASVFHNGEISIKEVKARLNDSGLAVRL